MKWNQKLFIIFHMAIIVHCPDCHARFDLEGGEVGDYFDCDDCACELVIKSLDPPKIEVLLEEK